MINISSAQLDKLLLHIPALNHTTIVACLLGVVVFVTAVIICDKTRNEAICAIASFISAICFIVAIVSPFMYDAGMEGAATQYYAGYVTDDSGDHVKSLLFKYDGTTYVMNVDDYDADCISLKMKRGITADKTNLVTVNDGVITVCAYDPSFSANMKLVKEK